MLGGRLPERANMAETIYLTERDFSDRYLVARRTAQRWRSTGEGPRWVRLGPRRVVYRLSDCEAWAAARTFEHRAAEATGRVAT
jgi:predicted DNA-binding transcriptional regulator AlpA